MTKQRKETSDFLFQQAEKFRKLAEADPTNCTKRVTYENLKSRAEALLTHELTVKGMKFAQAAEGADWWEAVKHMYRLVEREDGKVELISEARDWKGQKSWTHDSKWLAWAHIEKLVEYKHNDRLAGKGDKEADLLRVEELTKKRAA